MRRFTALSLVGLVMVQLFSNGCASLFNGKRGDLQLNSNPSGAKVMVDGVESGVTPIKLKLDEKKSHTVTLKSGKSERTIVVDKKIGAHWIVLDVLGGLIPVIIDAATGSWYSVDKHEENVQM